MTLPPLDCTHGQQRRAWHAIIAFGIADAVGRRKAWHAIIALGRKTWSNDVGRGMPSPHLHNSHAQQHRARHADIIALGQHILLATSGVAWHHRPWTAHTIGNVGHGMTSPPLDSTHGQKRRAWHDNTAIGKHTRSDDVERGMTSPPLGYMHLQTWHDIISL